MIHVERPKESPKTWGQTRIKSCSTSLLSKFQFLKELHVWIDWICHQFDGRGAKAYVHHQHRRPVWSVTCSKSHQQQRTANIFRNHRSSLSCRSLPCGHNIRKYRSTMPYQVFAQGSPFALLGPKRRNRKQENARPKNDLCHSQPHNDLRVKVSWNVCNSCRTWKTKGVS